MSDRELLHPRDQIVMIMERTYGYGMTTTSGGNLSIRDPDGSIWVSPGGVDKGGLQPRDVVCVRPDGTTEGIHKPSSELPFHRAIYEARPDLRAIVHAHPPALVSFSIIGEVPDTRIVPKARTICGEVGFAPYELPGSDLLGDSIARVFGEGYNAVLLENHGVVCGGSSLFEAFSRFETLDFCARLQIKAQLLGTPVPLTEEQLQLFKGDSHLVAEIDPPAASNIERELRAELTRYITRAYDRMLVTSTEGTFSARLGAGNGEFVITPYGLDRKLVTAQDLVYIAPPQQPGNPASVRRERGKTPSRSLLLHQEIYERHPEVNAIIVAHPPSLMAFGVAQVDFDTRTIPESYVMLRDIPRLEYGRQFNDRSAVAEMLSEAAPIAMFANDCVIVTGKNLLQAFDRIEVAEYSAKSLIDAMSIGTVHPIDDTRVEELRRAFGLE